MAIRVTRPLLRLLKWSPCPVFIIPFPDLFLNFSLFMDICGYLDIGLTDYKEAWDIQEKIHAEIVGSRIKNPGSHNKNLIIFCEHPHVYTLGKSGNLNNLLITDKLLSSIGASFYKTNRGGDITYHGPGQIVCYPILDLENYKLGIKKYIYLLEQSIIDTLEGFMIKAERYSGAAGVWIDTAKSSVTRKICSIGVRVSRFVTMHGFALNVNTDLNYFTYINPCGFNNIGVTSMQKELKRKINPEDVKKALLKNLSNNFRIVMNPIKL